MAKLIYNGLEIADVTYSGGGSGITEISLADTARIGYNTTYAHTSPIDANNYIDVNDTTVTLKRNSNQYAIYFYTPILEQGKKYVLMADNYQNTDGVRYWLKGSDIVSDPFQMTSLSSFSAVLGVPFVADGNYSYGIMTWSNNTNDIIVENPRLICLDD